MRNIFLLVFLLTTATANAQPPIYKRGTAAQRVKTKNFIINTTIIQNLNKPLNIATAPYWQDAFWGVKFLNYNTPFTQNKIKTAATNLVKYPYDFQYSFWSTVYKFIPQQFVVHAQKTIDTTTNLKLFAFAAEYLLAETNATKYRAAISTILAQKQNTDTTVNNNPFIRGVFSTLFKQNFKAKTNTAAILNTLLQPNYLPGQVLVISLQRPNRNYVGRVIIKQSNGKLLNFDSSNIPFNVAQLARAATNLPSYLSNGNTPQGFFKMDGFGISQLDAIGPTENIQLCMPVECNASIFLNDSTKANTHFTLQQYKQLLPPTLQNNNALLESYWAGAAGRFEIIAHGTTVDPEYYLGQTYYPFTPTAGCLATTEIWSQKDGSLLISDQQKLVNAVKKAGGAKGYLIVLETEHKNQPIFAAEILKLLQ
jgi:hypothetical protein